ncbi:MAG: hypothetical protein ACREN1_08340, partial [Candidatus Dormibacteria bacterium]
LAADHRVASRSPHAAGKTATNALALLWFALTRDQAGMNWKALLTAGAWRQLESYLLPEVHLWAKRVRWEVVGRRPFDERSELLSLNLKLSHGAASAGASDDPRLLEGMHADSVLVILDESKSIPASLFDSVEGALSGTGETFALASSTPGEPSGRFYEIHQRRPGLLDWRVFHVTLAQAVAAGRVSQSWADARRTQWGSTSAVYLQRVMGEFASSDEDAMIPLAWIEDSNSRWQAWDAAGRPDPAGRRIFGVDVATTGTDSTAVVTRQGNVVVSVERHHGDDTMTTSGRIAQKLSWPLSRAIVDAAGVGAGVLHRLRELQLPVVGFNSSTAPTGKDLSREITFLNRRAQSWWRLRELLDPSNEPTLCLPPDDQLVGDLCAPKWSMNSAGKLQVEGKDQIRKRLGRSPDVGDALAMAFSVPSGSYSADLEDGPGVVNWSEDPPGRNSGVVSWADDGHDSEPTCASPMWPRADW